MDLRQALNSSRDKGRGYLLAARTSRQGKIHMLTDNLEKSWDRLLKGRTLRKAAVMSPDFS